MYSVRVGSIMVGGWRGGLGYMMLNEARSPVLVFASKMHSQSKDERVGKGGCIKNGVVAEQGAGCQGGCVNSCLRLVCALSTASCPGDPHRSASRSLQAGESSHAVMAFRQHVKTRGRIDE